MPGEDLEQTALEPAKTLLDQEKSVASEMQKNIAEQQSDRYDQAILTIMRRSGDNVALVNSLNGFLETLINRSMSGELDKPLGQQQQADLIEFFDDTARRLGGSGHTGWHIER